MTRRNVGIAMMILGIIIIVITFMLTGCGGSVQKSADDDEQPANTRFDASLDHTTYFSDYITVIDKRTGVEYMLYVGSNKAAITMLVNPDGTPYVSKGDVSGD